MRVGRETPVLRGRRRGAAVLWDTVQRYLLGFASATAGFLVNVGGLVLRREVFAAGFGYAATVRLLEKSLAGK